jgi:hypothetical protein
MKLKSLLFPVAIAVSLIGLKIASGDEVATSSQERLVRVSPEEVTTSPVYYEGDEVRVYLEGHYPNTCYRPAETKFQVMPDTGEILINDYAAVSENSLCAMLMTPYTQAVELGTLPPGSYRVLINNVKDGSYRLAANLTIRPS